MPFSELSAHRATLEEAYMGLTRDAVEYRAERRRRWADDHRARCGPAPALPGPGTASPAAGAEWTKFRTVRGWVIGMVVAAALAVGVGLLFRGRQQLQSAAPSPRAGCRTCRSARAARR